MRNGHVPAVHDEDGAYAYISFECFLTIFQQVEMYTGQWELQSQKSADLAGSRSRIPDLKKEWKYFSLKMLQIAPICSIKKQSWPALSDLGIFLFSFYLTLAHIRVYRTPEYEWIVSWCSKKCPSVPSLNCSCLVYIVLHYNIVVYN